jgi:hypothetical protein
MKQPPTPAEIWTAARARRVSAEFALSRNSHPAVRAAYDAAVAAEAAAWAPVRAAYEAAVAAEAAAWAPVQTASK